MLNINYQAFIGEGEKVVFVEKNEDNSLLKIITYGKDKRYHKYLIKNIYNKKMYILNCYLSYEEEEKILNLIHHYTKENKGFWSKNENN